MMVTITAKTASEYVASRAVSFDSGIALVRLTKMSIDPNHGHEEGAEENSGISPSTRVG